LVAARGVPEALMSSAHYLRARAIRFRGLAHRAYNPDDARYLLELATYADLQAEALGGGALDVDGGYLRDVNGNMEEAGNMAELNPFDGVYATIAFVPGHMQGIVHQTWIAPHWLGLIEVAAGPGAAIYRMVDEGIAPVEAVAATKHECKAALLAAAAERGWRAGRVEISYGEDTTSHWHEGPFCRPLSEAPRTV
jgi:hypothetical protein